MLILYVAMVVVNDACLHDFHSVKRMLVVNHNYSLCRQPFCVPCTMKFHFICHVYAFQIPSLAPGATPRHMTGFPYSSPQAIPAHMVPCPSSSKPQG